MNNPTKYLSEPLFMSIPFVDILSPYTECFEGKLSKMNLSIELIQKLHFTLLKELSFVAEVTMQEELDCFRNNKQVSYQEFVVTTSSTLAIKYPVLDNILHKLTNNYLKHIQNIFTNFHKDFNNITKTFTIDVNEQISIKDIDTSLGDGHSGESTAMITLSDGTKLIYKPRNINITNSYNIFISWVNQKLSVNLKTFKCVSCGSYGWMEFVDNEAVNSHEDLKEYYYKSGILSAVTLLLGSKDCHYENIISSGKNPVIIDHETIIQPDVLFQSFRTWDDHYSIPTFSVLESMLIVNRDKGSPKEFAGFGTKGNVEMMDLEKQVINPNTINSKRDTRFVFRSLIKANIPKYNDAPVFANDYKHFFIDGFSTAYDMFLASKEELMSINSPISFFENQKIRYVWRPTFVYFKILKYLRQASFMSSFEAYKSKLYELMSKAYKKDNLKEYLLILESEMKQMLNGDIPFFNLNSLDFHLEEAKLLKVVRYNGIENIKQRIGLFSNHHKHEQLEYITKWLND